jgi:hypothetical protein
MARVQPLQPSKRPEAQHGGRVVLRSKTAIRIRLCIPFLVVTHGWPKLSHPSATLRYRGSPDMCGANISSRWSMVDEGVTAI